MPEAMGLCKPLPYLRELRPPQTYVSSECGIVRWTFYTCMCVSTAWQSICLQESSFLFSPSHLCHCRNTQPGMTSADTHTHACASTDTHVYIPSVCLSVCLFVDTHSSVRLSAHIPIKLIKASHLPSFCLSVCLLVCPSICLSSKRSQMMGLGMYVWGGFHMRHLASPAETQRSAKWRGHKMAATK